jgi:hypothetical protein
MDTPRELDTTYVKVVLNLRRMGGIEDLEGVGIW